MALTLLSANNASTVLAAGISASATTLTVNTGTGGLFPSPVSGTSFFKLTLIDSATGTLTEIVHVTARSGDAMTIVRGQEGTANRLWSANDIAANMMTAGTLDLFAQSGGLGGAALLNVGTTAGTVAAGNDSRITGALQKANNLSEIAAAGSPSVISALTNLKLTESTDGYVGRSVRVTTFPESGTITFAANTKVVRFKIWGAGQGGGSATAVTSPTGGASGAAAGYVEVIANIKALGLATVAITIGSGGAPAILNSGTQGGPGGATVVGTLATANGGVNGTGGSVSVNSLIGIIISVNGQNGQGGGVSGTGATGGAASWSFGGLPHAASVGDNGGFPGGGAAGGANIGPGNNYIGGRGANGLVIVEEYA
ncbi:tail fiber repeat 2-containing protein [Yersinia frederiksenii]|nr:tail fiber repeat 2-containing protein [Yersinia frederiksenii]CNL69348.1 tail fiber repeat 2-containing protein [Yersinia frederiksenii]